MEIRSITLFNDPDQPPAGWREFLTAAKDRFPYTVQSLRLATTPFPSWLDRRDPATAAMTFARKAHDTGIDYVSLGPVRDDHDDAWLDMIPAILATTQTIFTSVILATEGGRIDTGRCWQMARLIQRISTTYPDGFGNLFIGGLACCGPGHPFLPASYHGGGPAHFAIAVEAADLVLEAIDKSHTLPEARAHLVAAIESNAGAIVEVAEVLADEFEIRFSGIDFSPAPYPAPPKSLAAAMETLGGGDFERSWGLAAPGGLFTAAFITEAIDRATFPRTGFSGLMLPVLEDTTLAQRAAEGSLGLNDLLLYSAVCGVGLDTVPLPGDISEATLAGILLDTAALASRLRKPLVARLMPLPGLQAGDEVSFDFEYFAPSRVIDVGDRGIGSLLSSPVSLEMRPVRRRKGS